jgi:hypothetical protein
LDEAASQICKEEKMTKDRNLDQNQPRPTPKPQERPAPAQDGWSRKGSNEIRTTDWNKPPRPPKEKGE